MKRKVDLSTTVSQAAREVVDVLWEHPASVFGREESPENGGQSFRTDLHVDGRHGSVRHDVVVHLAPGPDLGTWRLAVDPVGGDRILPSFEGSLAVLAADDCAELHLVGSYEVPLGSVGAFGDVLVGHRLAIQSLRSFLAEVGERVDQRVDAAVPPGGRPAPYPRVLPRPELLPESWLG